MTSHRIGRALGTMGLMSLMFLCSLAGASDQAYRLPGIPYSFRAAPPMNGIDPQKVGEFWNTWKQVNVRFRKDNGEQRFIYANELAWKALKQGKDTFPEGAMFGKIAFNTKEDPLFPNSLQPNTVTRIQLMRKNAKDYPKTDSWGYALYLPDSRSTANPLGVEEIKDQAVCHGCHTLARKRDFIFASSSFEPSPGHSQPRFTENFRALFQSKKTEDLSKYGKAVLKAATSESISEIQFHQMALFVGGLSESVGPLSQYAAKEKVPFLLLDDERKQFLLAVPEADGVDCTEKVSIVMPITKFPQKEKVWRLSSLCGGKENSVSFQPLPSEVQSLEQEKP